MKRITIEMVDKFRERLVEEEKANATIYKYAADVKAFIEFINEGEITKLKVTEYKKTLVEKYAPSSVNAAIASLNHFFEFLGLRDMKLKSLRLQRKIFTDKEKELTKAEYKRLLEIAVKKSNKRLFYLMQTICSTGIRVSELKYITCEAVRQEKVAIGSKGKMRVVIIPHKLCKMLKKYAQALKIEKGPIFITRSGRPMDRSNIWHEMKKLCTEAEVLGEKVFPHNLRHLFARTYYSVQKDIVRLADILGHSSINTTRIYTMEAGDIHRKQIQELGLLLC